MKLPWKWIAVAVAGAIVVLAVLAAPLANLIFRLEEFLPGWGAGGVMLYALIYAAAPLLMLPTFPFGLGAGVLFGFLHGLVAATVGSVLTASVGFLLSRYLLRHRIERRIRRSRKFRALDDKVAADGWKIVGLLRLTWLHCGFSNYAYGLTAIPFRQYFLITAVTQVPGNAVTVYLGTAGMVGYEILMGVERERTALEYVLWGTGAAGALAAGTLISVKAKRAVEEATRKSGEAHHMDGDQTWAG